MYPREPRGPVRHARVLARPPAGAGASGRRCRTGRRCGARLRRRAGLRPPGLLRSGRVRPRRRGGTVPRCLGRPWRRGAARSRRALTWPSPSARRRPGRRQRAGGCGTSGREPERGGQQGDARSALGGGRRLRCGGGPALGTRSGRRRVPPAAGDDEQDQRRHCCRRQRRRATDGRRAAVAAGAGPETLTAAHGWDTGTQTVAAMGRATHPSLRRIAHPYPRGPRTSNRNAATAQPTRDRRGLLPHSCRVPTTPPTPVPSRADRRGPRAPSAWRAQRPSGQFTGPRACDRLTDRGGPATPRSGRPSRGPARPGTVAPPA